MLNKPTHEVELVYYGTTGTFRALANASIKMLAPDAPTDLHTGLLGVHSLQR